MVRRITSSIRVRHRRTWLTLASLALLCGTAQAARQTTLASRGLFGASGNGTSLTPSLSKNGRFVAFASIASDLIQGDTNGSADAFLFGRKRHKVTRFSLASNGRQPNGTVFDTSISGNGKIAAFDSVASNLVRRDQNGLYDVFLRRLKR